MGFWYEILVSKPALNETSSEITTLDFSSIKCICKVTISVDMCDNMFGFVAGYLTAILCIAFFWLLRVVFVRKYYRTKCPKSESVTRSCHSQEKYSVNSKFEYPSETDVSGSSNPGDVSSDTEAHRRVLDILPKETVGAHKQKIPKEKIIKLDPKNVVFKADIPPKSLTSLGSRRLSGVEWQNAFRHVP